MRRRRLAGSFFLVFEVSENNPGELNYSKFVLFGPFNKQLGLFVKCLLTPHCLYPLPFPAGHIKVLERHKAIEMTVLERH